MADAGEAAAAAAPGPAAADGTMVAADGPHNPYNEAKKALVVSTGSATASVLATSQMRTKMHDPENLIELARFVQSADSHTKSVVGGKLELISEQIRALQEQAKTVLTDARRDLELSHAKCNFQRKPGNTYHLYRKVTPDGVEEVFFSMLSPNEWAGSPPHEYMDSYRLEYDMSWTQVDRIEERDRRRQFNPMLLGLSEEDLAAGESITGAPKQSLTMI